MIYKVKLYMENTVTMTRSFRVDIGSKCDGPASIIGHHHMPRIGDPFSDDHPDYKADVINIPWSNAKSITVTVEYRLL